MSANSLKLIVNDWLIDLDSGEVRAANSGTNQSAGNKIFSRIEPQGIKFLCALLDHKNHIVDKDQLIESIWPGQVVTDDALTRCVSRLRKALQDNPKEPQFIETIPKRGYRLIAEVSYPLESGKTTLPHVKDSNETQKPVAQSSSTLSPMPLSARTGLFAFLIAVLGVGIYLSFFKNDTHQQHAETKESVLKQNTQSSHNEALLDKADDYYFRIRRQDNEMAIDLYQQVIALKPDSGAGQAGLANALVQQVIRWPNPANTEDLGITSLGQALKMEYIGTEASQKKLQRALALAQRAVKVSPHQARTHKALGFVYGAMGEFDKAIESHKNAVATGQVAWDALFNIGDILEIQGRLDEAIVYYERSFDAMTELYSSQSARISPWYADVGAVIGDKHISLGQLQDAEAWYRHVLSFSPLNTRATRGLALLLASQGDRDSAKLMCDKYLNRVGENVCEGFF